MDTKLEEVSKYIEKYRKDRFTDDEIRAGLVKSKVSFELIEKAFSSQGSSRRLSVLLSLGIGIFLLLVVFFLYLLFGSFSSSECSEEQDCPQGSFCSEGTCIEEIGILNCQVEENCERGYSCYKCVEQITSGS